LSHRTVYQLDHSVSAPRRVAGQLVVDPSDPEHPYTITFHLRYDDLDLNGLIASGRAEQIAGPASPSQPPSTLPRIRLIS
jgi:hypothetical protein